MEPPPNGEIVTSLKFCDPHADLTFRSRDGVDFKIHSKHLSSTSSGFAVAELTIISSDPIPLQETSDVLEILFQFVHPPAEPNDFRQPSVALMEIGLFFRVAEAAEKYVVFGAMNTCITRMEFNLYISHPFEVLNHTAKHGYNSLRDQVAPITISKKNPLIQAADILTHPGLLATWVKYFNRWNDIPRYAGSLLSLTGDATRHCRRINQTVTQCIKKLLDDGLHHAENLRLQEPVYTINCDHPSCVCTATARPHPTLAFWKRSTETKVAAIPKFGDIV